MVFVWHCWSMGGSHSQRWVFLALAFRSDWPQQLLWHKSKVRKKKLVWFLNCVCMALLETGAWAIMSFLGSDLPGRKALSLQPVQDCVTQSKLTCTNELCFLHSVTVHIPVHIVHLLAPIHIPTPSSQAGTLRVRLNLTGLSLCYPILTPSLPLFPVSCTLYTPLPIPTPTPT